MRFRRLSFRLEARSSRRQTQLQLVAPNLPTQKSQRVADYIDQVTRIATQI